MPNHRKPTALRLLQGNAGKRPINTNEPQYQGSPKCPAWLPLEAKREWRRVFRLLEPYDILKPTDMAVFASYCLSYARWKQAERMIDAEGQTVREPVVSRSGHDTGKYKIRIHPAVAVAKAEKAAMQRTAALLGLDPSNRTRIVAGNPNPEPNQQQTSDQEHLTAYIFQ
jgi:P27 family predicted phage terminase small subunit